MKNFILLFSAFFALASSNFPLHVLGQNIQTKPLSIEEKDELYLIRGEYFSLELLKNGAVKNIKTGSYEDGVDIIRSIELIFWDFQEWRESHQGDLKKISITGFEKKEMPDGYVFSFKAGMQATSAGDKINFDETISISSSGILNVMAVISPQQDLRLNRAALCTTLNFEHYKGVKYEAVIGGDKGASYFTTYNDNTMVLNGGLTYMKLFRPLLPPLAIEFPSCPTQIEKWSDRFDFFNLATYNYPAVSKGDDKVLQVKISIPNLPIMPKEIKGKIVLNSDKVIRPINPEIFGINDHHVHDDNFDRTFLKSEKLKKLLKDSGIHSVRMCIPCFTNAYNLKEDPIAPYDGAPYKFDAMDPWIDTMVNELHINPMIIAGYYCPVWLSTMRGKANESRWVAYRCPPKDNEKLADIIAAMVKHYNIDKKWRLPYIEIGNEPDVDNYWVGGTFDEYIAYYKAVAKKVRAVDPEIKIAGPALGDSGDSNMKNMKKFFDECWDLIDIVSWHDYRTINQNIGYDKVSALMKGRKDADKKICYMGEFNIESNGMDPRVKNIEGAYWGARTYKNIIESGYGMAAWFDFNQTGYGIVDFETAEPLPSYYMIQLFTIYGRFDEGSLIKADLKSSPGLEIVSCKTGNNFSLMCIKTDSLTKNIERISLKGAGLQGVYTVKVYLLDANNNDKLVNTFEIGKDRNYSFDYTFSGRNITLFVIEKTS